MHGQQIFMLDETDAIRGRITDTGKLSLSIGDLILLLTEPQAREVLDTLIDLVSESRTQGMAA